MVGEPDMSTQQANVIRHENAESIRDVRGVSSAREIQEHVERHLGKINSVFHEIVSDTIHLDILFLMPNERFPFVRLVTMGVSDLPMQTPNGSKGTPKYIELMIALPPNWQLDDASLRQEQWYWPLRLLKFLGRLPHKHATWLGYGHTIATDDPPKPFADSTRLCAALILSSSTVPEDFHRLKISHDKTIEFLCVIPIHREELDFKLGHGLDSLFDCFDTDNVGEIVEPGRHSAA